jgi:hypothetical protein
MVAAAAAAALVALFCAVYPMYVIRPFRQQGADELNAALLTMQVRPVLTVVCAGFAALVIWRLWGSVTGRWPRVVLAASLAVACLSAVAARINVFEIMFHPIDNPAFEPVQQAKLDVDEKVLTVLPNGVARAYPIRAIAYHHIVNDVVGGVPLVATY